jgi:renalase
MDSIRGRVAIVGAGVSGLSCAQALVEWGYEVVLFDKSRGPGGRVCTRRRESARFDHGAQYFTVSDPQFDRVVQRLVDAGVVAPWVGRFGTWADGSVSVQDSGRPRWVGVPRMSSLARAAGDGLDIRLQSRIIDINRLENKWTLTDEQGTTSSGFDWVVVTCPGPQAQSLIPVASPLYGVAGGFDYQPCWAALLAFESPVPWAYDGVSLDHNVLAWVARDSSKPGRGDGDRWVLHAQPGWSRTNVATEPEVALSVLRAAFREVSGGLPTETAAGGIHRWLYARSTHVGSRPVNLDRSRRLGLCGDGASGARLEQAWLSGIEMAKVITEL